MVPGRTKPETPRAAVMGMETARMPAGSRAASVARPSVPLTLLASTGSPGTMGRRATRSFFSASSTVMKAPWGTEAAGQA